MKLKNIISVIVLAAAITPAYAQLKLDDGTASSPYFIFRNDTVKVSYDKDFTTIPVMSNQGYKFACNDNWLNVNKESNGNLSIFVDYNYMGVDRVAKIAVSTEDGSYTDTLFVKQAAADLTNSTIDFNTERSLYFSDKLCSQLKDGVTDEDILSMKNPVLKSLAYAIKSGNYDEKYRVAQYKSFYAPWQLISELKTSFTYNNHENPTGIYFKAGEKVAVICDGITTSGVGLKIRNFGPTDYSETNYDLSNGVNIITPTSSGNGYINYYDTRAAYAGNPQIGVHFVMGTQNGYYDLRNGETNEDYLREIAAAPGQCFDLVGKYAQCVFPLDVLRSNTPDGEWTTLQFDSIVYWERHLLGLFKYNRDYGNHQAIITVAKSGGLYHANNDGCCIPYQALSQPTTSKPDYFDYWGMAHELGHVNQTAGVLWIGLTEVTNNIMSAYCEDKLKKSGYHRLENESGAFRYYRYLEKVVRPGNTIMPHADGDVFATLVPFYQLLVYTDGTGIRPDAYPDTYEHMRTSDVPAIQGGNTNENYFGDGQRQVNFCKSFCDAAKIDFTDFFVKCGMLKAVNVVQGDYDTRRLQITQAMVDECIDSVKAKNYEKAPAGLYFIDTYNKYAFRDKVTVPTDIPVGTGCTRSGSTVTIKHASWPNVVGFKTYDKDGKLLHITNYGHGFRGSGNNWVPTSTQCEWNSSENPAKIVAVSYDDSEVVCYQP